jgi:bacillithiol biosynthesis cysteine-adding enzyme BshC
VTDNLTTAWLADELRSRPFLSRAFATSTGRAAAVDAAAKRRVPDGVLATIREQNARLCPSSARDAHLDALAEAGTTCVVTGQQVGLFLGPLYTLYKAASAVAAAKALTAETGRPVVPVFWIQNEDHDFDEICRVAAPDIASDGLRWFDAAVDSTDLRCSVSERSWSGSVATACEALTDLLSGLPDADRTLAMFRDAYTPGVSPCGSFIPIVAELFADDGLVIVDPSDSALAALAAPIHRRAITEAHTIAEALAARVHALKNAGFRVQVHVRPGAPLSYYHPDGSDGPRMRITPCPEGWSLVGTDRVISTDTVIDDLERRPERFSTSALLRPILQDSWLPTVAYVGGPGELAYFGQLGPLYDAFGLPMPMPMLRGRFEVLDPRAARFLDALGLSPADLGATRNTLLAKVGSAGPGPSPADTLETELLAAITGHLAAARPNAEAVAGDLGKHFEKTERAMGDFARRLSDRYRRAIATQDGVSERRLDALLAWFRPDGAPQERLYGAPWFLARFGRETFMATLRDAIEPFSPGLRTLDFTGSGANV